MSCASPCFQPLSWSYVFRVNVIKSLWATTGLFLELITIGSDLDNNERCSPQSRSEKKPHWRRIFVDFRCSSWWVPDAFFEADVGWIVSHEFNIKSGSANKCRVHSEEKQSFIILISILTLYLMSHTRFFTFTVTLWPFPMQRLQQGEHTLGRARSLSSPPFYSKLIYWSLVFEFLGHHIFETGTECKGWYAQIKVLLAEEIDETPANLIQSGKPKDHGHLKIT